MRACWGFVQGLVGQSRGDAGFAGGGVCGSVRVGVVQCVFSVCGFLLVVAGIALGVVWLYL